MGGAGLLRVKKKSEAFWPLYLLPGILVLPPTNHPSREECYDSRAKTSHPRRTEAILQLKATTIRLLQDLQLIALNGCEHVECWRLGIFVFLEIVFSSDVV